MFWIYSADKCESNSELEGNKQTYLTPRLSYF